MESEDKISSDILTHLVSANAAWPEASQRQMAILLEEIIKNNKYVSNIAATNQNASIQAGFIAEEMHRFTHNAQAILQHKSVRAFTSACDEWKSLGFRCNDPQVDIVTVQDGSIASTHQVKYYQTAQKTEAAMRVVENGTPKYSGCDSYIGPADQVNPVDGKPGIADYAHRTRLKNLETRSVVSKSAEQVESRVSDSVNGMSRSITKREAEIIAKDPSNSKQIHGDYKNNLIIGQMKYVAASAAGISAVIAGTINTFQFLTLVRQGKISLAEAVKGIIINTAISSVDSAMKAAGATGAVCLATSSCSVGTIASQTLNSMAGRAAIAGGAICAIDLIECMVLVAAGKMTLAELETRTGKNIFQTAAGVWGSSVGMNIASSLGVTTGFPLALFGIAGGLIAGVAISFAIENHIERHYQEVMANTSILAQTAKMGEDISRLFADGQKVLAAVLFTDLQLKQEMSDQLVHIDRAGDEMNRKISRL